MRGGGAWSPCLRTLGGQRGFWRERRKMASGNGLPSSLALVAKRPSALGPFPRYIWIHQDTPQDSLDKACHEIWKRVQGLPEALQSRSSTEQLSATGAGMPRDHRLSFIDETLEISPGKDEISLLVEQEFLSLTKEHLILVKENSGKPEAPGSSPKEARDQPAPCTPAPPPVAGGSEQPGASITAGDELLEQKVAESAIGSRQDCDSAVSTVTGILRAAKGKSATGMENRGHSPGASNSEISKLLAQFPLKSTETSKAPDNKMVLEETRVIKDFLQNSMFSSSGPSEPPGLGPFLLLPPAPPLTAPGKLPELPAQKRQLPVFAKICSKPEPDSEGHPLLQEQNPSNKDSTKCQDCLFVSQWPQSRKDTCGEEGCNDPVGTPSIALPPKKPAWPAEKNLLYEFLGATKNPSRQLKLRNKVDVDGLELKLNPPVTAADKNNIKYTGNVFNPRFATALTSATLNQPLWLNLNYPPPPVFPNHTTFPQYQGLYPQRAARMPYQQAVHPQLGCYSRPVTPYNPQQTGQQIFRSSYTPLLSYIPFVQPNYSYSQRTPPKLSTNPRDPSPMAGDGPQYLLPQAYGFGSTSGGPLMNSPYFSSSGNGINF
ncbi:uncharacterized protein C1orf94 homolog [Lepus europaeus]|uniref:uncharacterized protein C1orf94 homolog n=1 Tax=Lepus europaeus TaxID=9983 RepID=UPI002B4A94E9|nr:uncharacterized protein C1orf94 homolog [Lepus europaeus]